MKKTSLKALLGAGASAVALLSAPAFAADLDPQPDKEYVEVGSFRGSILLPNTGISFKVGGYAKGDIRYTFDDFSGGSPGAAETLFFGSSFFGTGGDRVAFHALQTRLNFDARTTTDLGSARAFIEGDFFNFDGNENQSNSANLRLRHAFAELGIESLGGSLLIGQTWSNFGDLGSYANTLDFNGPNAQFFARQAQIRWTQPLSDSVTLSVSAENPEIAQGAPGGSGLDAVPLFTARLAANSAFGSFSVSGLVSSLNPDNAVGQPGFAFGTTDTAIRWAVQGAGTINIGEKDKFRFQVNYGDGQGRLIQAAGPAFNIVGGAIDTIQQFGVLASYQHFWSDKLQSNLVGGHYILIDNDIASAVTAATLESETYAAINLIYSPRGNINLGIEGLYGRAENVGGASEDGFAIQTSLQFAF